MVEQFLSHTSGAKMRVAHVAPSARSDTSAAWRIRKAQTKLGIDAFAMVHVGEESAKVHLMRRPGPLTNAKLNFEARLDGLPIRMSERPDASLPWSSGWSGYKASRRIKRSGAEIVNLHWTTTGCIGLRDLHRLTIPVVMTLHDVWSVTGGCHCNLGCEGWREGCIACPQLTSGPFGLPLPEMLWKHKAIAYENIADLSVVSPSHWLAKMAIESGIFKQRQVHVIRNCLDTELFKPGTNPAFRQKHGISPDTTVMLFGAVNALSTSYKGYDLLREALKVLPSLSLRRFHLVVFGSDGGLADFPYPVTFLGHLNDEESLVASYQAADIFVTPSRQDNYPSTVLEASACGIPSVGFDIGGIPEMIVHQQTGYVAGSFDVTDFASGIAWISEDNKRRNYIGAQARKLVERSSTEAIVANQYLDLYGATLTKDRNPIHLPTFLGTG